MMVKVPVLSCDIILFLFPFSEEIGGGLGSGLLTHGRCCSLLCCLEVWAVSFQSLKTEVVRLSWGGWRRDTATVVWSSVVSYP